MSYGFYERRSDQIDGNHFDHLISQEFVQSVEPQLGIHPQQLRAIFYAADTNNDDILSCQELNDFFDLNHDGRFDPYEMQH